MTPAALDMKAEAKRLHEEARWLAERFHVHPLDHPSLSRCAGIRTRSHDPDTCNERGKEPVWRWSSRSTQDPDEILKGWTDRGFHNSAAPRNIGIDCGKSGLLVIDEDAEGEFERFCESVGVEVPLTFTVTTAKGKHYYFAQPEGQPLGNSEGALRGFKLNVRGTGGYVVGPGSLHATGVRYEVETAAEIAPAPSWLIEALRAARTAKGAPSSNGQHADGGDHFDTPAADHQWWQHGPIGEGDRHNALVAASGWCLRMGLTLAEATMLVRDVHSRCAGDKYTWEQAKGKLNDVYNRYEPGDRLGERRGEQGAGDEQSADDETLWSSSERLKVLAQFAQARMLSPWALLGVVLAMVASRVGPHVVLPPTVVSKASLNLLVGLVAASGGGKTGAVAAATDFLWLDEDEIPTHELGTGQGVTSVYTQPPSNKGERVNFNDAALFLNDEVGTLDAHASMKGANVLATLKSAYSGAQLGARYADKDRRRPVRAHHYRFALITGIQPPHAGVILNDADGGFPQRWLWLPANDPHASPDRPEEPLKGAGTFAVPTELAAHGVDEIMGVVRKPEIEIPLHADAVAEIQAARHEGLLGKGDPTESHRLLTQCKVAALLAIWHGRHEVDQWEWETARAILARSDKTRRVCEKAVAQTAKQSNIARAAAEVERGTYVAEEATQRVARAVLRALQRDGDWVGGADLRKRSTSAADRGFFAVAVERLIAAGQAEQEETTHGWRYRSTGK